MGLFDKSISDEMWLNATRPVYERVVDVIKVMEDAIASGSLEQRAAAVSQAAMQLPPIIAELNGSDPSSSGMKAAKKSLRKAASTALDAVKQGQTLFRDLTGGPGERLQMETGFARRAAGARLAFSQNMMDSLTESAAKNLREASLVFEARRDG